MVNGQSQWMKVVLLEGLDDSREEKRREKEGPVGFGGIWIIPTSTN